MCKGHNVVLYANISSPENKFISGTVAWFGEASSLLSFLCIDCFSTRGEKCGTTCSAEETKFNYLLVSFIWFMYVSFLGSNMTLSCLKL